MNPILHLFISLALIGAGLLLYFGFFTMLLAMIPKEGSTKSSV